MRPEPGPDVVLLKRDTLLRIHAIAGREIACVRGSVWLTQEGDRRDVVLVSGATFVLDRPGLALAWAAGGEAALALDEELHAERVQQDAPRRFRAADTLQDAIDAIEPRYEPGELATMSIGMRNAIVQREARRLRARVAAVLARWAARRIAGLWRRFASSVFAPLSTRSALRRAE